MILAHTSKEKPACISLPGSRRLLLRRWQYWQDFYLAKISPLLGDGVLSDGQRVNSSHNAHVWKLKIDGTAVFIKFFKLRGLKDRLLVFRKSRALRAAEGSLLLIEKGFLAPALIAQGDVVDGIRVKENFLVTQWIDESCSVYSCLDTFFRLPLTGERLAQKRAFLKALGQMTGRLHHRGIFHGDLRLGNVLVKNLEKEALFYFIDNERNKYFSKGIPDRLRRKNLVQLNMIVLPQITFTDRLRFFKAYLKENPELEPVAKEWMRKVFLKTKKRLQKKLPTVWSNIK